MVAYSVKGKQLFDERMEFVFSHFPNLKERLDQKGGTMSGGEQQMRALAIGCALMMKPDLLILDEPSKRLALLLIKFLKSFFN